MYVLCIDVIVIHCFVMDILPPKSELNLSYARSTPPLATPSYAQRSESLVPFSLSFSLLPQACLLRYLFSLSGVYTHFKNPPLFSSSPSFTLNVGLAMADPQVSPISQLLHTLGITREDLNKRSDQMRQFLTADNALASRVIEGESGRRSRSSSDLRPNSRSTTSSSALSRSLSRGSTSSLRDATPPATPIKSEPHEGGLPHRHFDNMEMVIERQRRQSRREKKSRREKERDLSSRGAMPHPPSPSPSNASQSGLNLDTFMQSRDDRRGPISGVDSASQDGAPKVSRRVRRVSNTTDLIIARWPALRQ